MAVRIRQSTCTAPSWYRASRRRTTISRWRSCSIAAGILSAARERYYVAIELDEDFVEARSNLGCVLAEQGDLALAEAAFRGALEFHPDYADAHYHLARLLDHAHRAAEAARHWQLFMNLAPASPWADEARDRMSGGK